MNKAYNRINWENYPSDSTPLNESNLNRIDSATDTLDNRVISLDNTKATKTEVATLVQDVTFEEKTGIITITKKNGSQVTIDTQMEKIAVNFDYDATTQKIILTLIDGTKQYIDLAALITQWEFLETETIAFSINSAGKVSAIVKEASIKEKHLQPNYLADIKVETAKAAASQKAAAASESNAKTSETNSKNNANNASASATKAQSYAVGGTNSRTGENTDNAKYYSEQAAEKQKIATQNANTATTKASEATKSAEAAKASENVAIQSANTAAEKAKSATDSATSASNSANTATENATKSKNYAVGDTDSAKYYYEKTKEAVGGAGAVTGVKGNNETVYRAGNVNITAENIGALPTSGGVVNGDITPGKNELYDLGTSGNKWDNAWIHCVEADVINGELNGNAATATKATQDANGDDIVKYYRKRRGGIADDFNKATIEGVYTYGNATQMLNGYSNTAAYGTLEVFNNKYNGTSGSQDVHIVQVAYATDGKIYTRQRVNTNAWTKWINITITYADGQLYVRNPAYDKGYVRMFTNSEGGNIQIQSPNGINYEIDSYNGDIIRLFAKGDDENYRFVIFNRITGELSSTGGFNGKINGYSVNANVPADAKFTDTTYANFVKSGSGAKAGLVPAPSTTAGTTKYLREDGTWQVPPNTWRGIQNNITSDSTTDSLSAAQGKVLKSLIDNKATKNDTVTLSTTSDGAIGGYFRKVTLNDGTKITSGFSAEFSINFTNPYGSMYYTDKSINLPQHMGYFHSINVTPFATSTGLPSVAIIGYTSTRLDLRVWNPKNETTKIRVHITIIGKE